MRRVLLVTFVFPPSPYIGAVRPGGLAKYLPNFGWEPIVLTSRVPNGNRPSVRVIETDYEDVIASLKQRIGLDPKRGLQQQLQLKGSSKPGAALPHSKLIRWLRTTISYPDETKGWIPFALKAIQQIGSKERIDAIFSTSPPISAHLVAVRAKAILHCPWVADFRDPWIDDGMTTGGLKVLRRSLERRTLRSADALITVSDPWAGDFRERYPGKLVARATNGFDPEEQAAASGRLDPNFSITYTGDLYQGKRDPSLLFEVLAEMIADGKARKVDIRLNFYGSSDPWLTALAGRFGLSDVVCAHGAVPRSESLQHQRESQMLLLLGRNVPSDAGCYAGKLFEYLASRRPILALGGLPGVTQQLLNETGAGCHIFAKADLRQFLTVAYGEFRSSGRVRYNGRPEVISQYTHSAMAMRIADVLNQVVTRS
jgi:glycosyltransferase involved in cell wall biosynthesis